MSNYINKKQKQALAALMTRTVVDEDMDKDTQRLISFVFDWVLIPNESQPYKSPAELLEELRKTPSCSGYVYDLAYAVLFGKSPWQV